MSGRVAVAVRGVGVMTPGIARKQVKMKVRRADDHQRLTDAVGAGQRAPRSRQKARLTASRAVSRLRLRLSAACSGNGKPWPLRADCPDSIVPALSSAGFSGVAASSPHHRPRKWYIALARVILLAA